MIGIIQQLYDLTTENKDQFYTHSIEKYRLEYTKYYSIRTRKALGIYW